MMQKKTRWRVVLWLIACVVCFGPTGLAEQPNYDRDIQHVRFTLTPSKKLKELKKDRLSFLPKTNELKQGMLTFLGVTVLGVGVIGIWYRKGDKHDAKT